MTVSSKPLSKYPPASFRELTTLSFPFILVLFAGSLMGLYDRWILARYSLESAEAAISALYLIQLFQLPCVRIASVVQIFIGQYKGANRLSDSGSIVWQMIWFSLFSMVIVVPLSWPICKFFFQNTIIQIEGISYFRYLISVNFLFPLGAALSSFYLGQGQTRKVLTISLASHIVHISLDILLIFGVKGFIPTFGVRSAALASAAAQFFFCALLFWDFLKPMHRQLYNTARATFRWISFWKCLQIGGPRGGHKLALLIAWAAITHVMIHKKEDYLAVLAFGGTLNLFYTCFSEGMGQAIITIAAYLIGSKQLLLWKLARSALFLLLIGAALLTIPCLFFPETLITYFFKEKPSVILNHELYLSCYWLWLLFVTYSLNMIFIGLLNSYGDTFFQMLFAIIFGWLANFLPVYLIIGKMNAPPNRLWLIMSLPCLMSTLTYLLRLYYISSALKSTTTNKLLLNKS